MYKCPMCKCREVTKKDIHSDGFSPAHTEYFCEDCGYRSSNEGEWKDK